MTAAASPIGLIETMRWQGGIRLLGRHLGRMTRSARVLGIPFDAAGFVAAVASAGSAHGAPCIVRAELAPDGRLAVAVRPLDPPVSGPVRLAIASLRLDAANPLLAHKTTRRAVYDAAWDEARRAGCGEALLLNEDGEVCEGSRTSLFARIDGAWATPAIEAGLLPGVYRGYLLAAHPAIATRALRLDDLLRADALAVGNAVYGLRAAVLA